MNADSSSATAEIAAGDRFAFGRNWQRFLRRLDDSQVQSAQLALEKLLGDVSLTGLRFLDAGSGSGLMSLAAQRAGAALIVSFDFDPASVASTQEIRSRTEASDDRWRVVQGSMLDRAFLSTLGEFDIVYCWGVAHHTGSMWEALDNLVGSVRPDGILVVAIYNDQGWRSSIWRGIKKRYVRSGRLVRALLVLGSGVALYGPRLAMMPVRAGLQAVRMLRGGSSTSALGRVPSRGMSRWHDLVDWVGGYPFEYARPEAIEQFYQVRGFTLERRFTCGRKLGCNEFVLRRHLRK